MDIILHELILSHPSCVNEYTYQHLQLPVYTVYILYESTSKQRDCFLRLRYLKKIIPVFYFTNHCSNRFW